MRRGLFLFLAIAFVCESWAVPKPMESVTNYNVMMIHGAYGPKNSDGVLQGFDPGNYVEAIDASGRLGAASMGSYTSNNRVTRWISHKILEEPEWKNDSSYVRHSYVYNWRAFSNTRNSSKNNAVEFGDRTWNKNGKYGKRRALVEEAQEVKAVYDTLRGQTALQIIRQNPDLYRQLASRYILIGHSMGGVVSREYVQGNFYNGDVDKIITLDSPHEGTGALNMQLDMKDASRTGLEGLTGSVSVMSSTAMAMWMAGYDPGTLTVGLLGLGVSMGAAATNLGVGALVSLFLEDYAETDPLVCYVDPHAHDKPACDGEENIIRLKDLYTPPDTLPMFRLMAGKNSMTFTDPKLAVRNALSLFIPDMVTVPFANLYAQVSGGESFSVNYANAITGTLLGVLGGVNVQAHGSSLVETSGGLAKHTAMLTDENVDVKRYEFNAAYYVSESWPSYVMEITLAAGTSALAANYLPLPYGSIAKAAIGVGAAAGISSSIVTAFGAGIMDLASSHNLPIDNVYDNQNTWRADYSNTVSPIAGSSVNDTTITPLVMEDFLYERPFVNLALLDSATLEALSKMELPDREKSPPEPQLLLSGLPRGCPMRRRAFQVGE